MAEGNCFGFGKRFRGYRGDLKLTVPCTQETQIRDIHEALVGTLTEPGLRTLVANMADTVVKIEHTVFGNSRAGLVEIVNGLVEDRRRKKDSKGEWVIIVSLLITNAVALLVPFLGKHP